MSFREDWKEFVQVSFRASWEMIMFFIPSTLLAASLKFALRVQMSYDPWIWEWWRRFVSCLLGMLPAGQSLFGLIVGGWNASGYWSPIDAPEVVCFSDEHIRYTLTRFIQLQTLNIIYRRSIFHLRLDGLTTSEIALTFSALARKIPQGRKPENKYEIFSVLTRHITVRISCLVEEGCLEVC